MALLFVGHDPGAINHVRPLLERAEAAGRPCRLVELRDPGAPWPGDEAAALRRAEGALAAAVRDLLPGAWPALAVCGISTNRAEQDFVRACRRRLRVQTAVLIDFAPGHRLGAARPGDAGFPDFLWTTSPRARADLLERYGLSPDRVVMVGSTFLGKLAAEAGSPVQFTRAEVLKHYYLHGAIMKNGTSVPMVSSKCPIVPYFLSPDDMVPDAAAAIPRCLELFVQDFDRYVAFFEERNYQRLPGSTECCIEWIVVFRPHPRNEAGTIDAVQEAVDGLGRMERIGEHSLRYLYLDRGEGRKIDNKSLVRASIATVTMGSTLSVESLCWGVPSAFFKRGWDDTRIEQIMGGLPVERLNTPEETHDFLEAAASRLVPEANSEPVNVEHCLGAVDRAWQWLEGRLPGRLPAGSRTGGGGGAAPAAKRARR